MQGVVHFAGGRDHGRQDALIDVQVALRETDHTEILVACSTWEYKRKKLHQWR